VLRTLVVDFTFALDCVAFTSWASLLRLLSGTTIVVIDIGFSRSIGTLAPIGIRLVLFGILLDGVRTLLPLLRRHGISFQTTIMVVQPAMPSEVPSFRSLERTGTRSFAF
jgi:hypothetical protein